MIPSSVLDERSRLKIKDFLVFKNLLVTGDWFCDSNGNLISGYIKGSPANHDVSLALADFGLDIEQYKRSLNPNIGTKRVIDGTILNQSYRYSSLLREYIKNDSWFVDNFEIDEKCIYIENKLVQTTSNSREYSCFSK